ncbi:PA2169 family four-helix-bundle protein [Candidatus Odyssella thessalonicensis]|uniref:PA2169 family four-helix-bundle protein n=1 Tax=Candidatus Odyssella thessalonicensis TaxID=84647 RepID=UPI000225AEB5|nr:PA2169 family four-helix-bundle protein [Candidatus Odyssella thessalonicensis]
MTADSVSVLNQLIQITRDSEEGFRTAAANVKDAFLKTTFLEKAETCRNAILDLQDKVREMHGVPEESGTVLGALHRGWVTIKGTLTGKDDLALLNECERGEDVIKETYEKALESGLSEQIRPLVQQQYEGVKKDHDLVKNLRNKYAQSSAA